MKQKISNSVIRLLYATRSLASSQTPVAITKFAILVFLAALVIPASYPSSTEAINDLTARLIPVRAFTPWSLGNYPNTSVQLSGNATVVPDATPSATTSINISTSTNFKGKLEADPATGVIRVTNAHPAGSYLVTVTGFDGVPTIKTFTLTVTTAAACPSITFATASNFPVGTFTNPTSVAVGDFNGDGKQDLALSEQGFSKVWVLLGTGNGSFGSATSFTVNMGAPQSVTVGDFNGDGNQDLATADLNSTNISILLGNGAGSFGAATHFAAGSDPYSLAAGDFNGDAKQDIAVGRFNSNIIAILLGNGAGGFGAATNITAASDVRAIKIGDFNNDGKQDIVTANSVSANLSVFLGNGTGGFAAPANFNVNNGPFSIAVADFNNDGNQDLAAGNQSSSNISILLGNGAGSFSAATSLGIGLDPISIAAGDFDGDGKQDLAVTNASSGNVSVFVGNGSGGFGPPNNFGVGNTPFSIAVGDFNGDGKQDIATANANSANASVLLRQCPPPAQFSITGRVLDLSDNPLSGIAVAITGSSALNTTTDAGGNFTFASVDGGGNYTVTASNPNYSFTAGQIFNNLNQNRIANFVGMRTIVGITGTVTDVNNAALNNVTVALTKNGAAFGTAQTNVSGNYSFGNLAAGANYVVTPVGGFTPASLSLGNLTADASANFKATPSVPPQCNTTSFSAATNFTVGSKPHTIAIGDFNNDGKSDLATANTDSDNISILLGTGTGGFGSATNFAAGSVPESVAIGDFNNDGATDLAVANLGSNNVSILLGTGTGNFGSAVNFAVGTNPRSVAIGDFDNDGKIDLAVANSGSANVSILLGTGTGGFSAPLGFNASGHPQSVAVADFNKDGKLDIVVADGDSNDVATLLGTGTGSFSDPNLFTVSGIPQSVGIGDFNGDGKMDLAVARGGGSGVAILLSEGAGNFGAATNFAVGNRPFSVAIGDLNGDTKSDLAVADFSLANASIALGTGTGSFVGIADFAVGGGPQSVVIGDFNGDGKADLAVSDGNSNKVAILLNNSATCNTQGSLTISGRVSNAANGSIADVTVTMSGPVTRSTTTDASGNYTFANLTAGGDYAVTVQSNYFVFAPSRADYFNLASNQIANFIAAPLAVPLPTPTPNDDFTATARDATKWTLGTQTEPVGAFDPRVTTAQVNGQLVISPLAQAVGLHYAGYVSANSFDMRNGSARVEVVKAASGGADTIFAVGTDVDNFYRFMVHTPGAATSLASLAKGRAGLERPLDATVAQLVFQVNVGGQLTSLSINYDPVQHRFMRFRHIPVTNSIVFETSPDDVSYTVHHTVVLQKSVSALTAELSAGTSNPANPGSAVFDNFTLVTSTFQFSAGSYSVGEGDGSILVTVTRAGSLSDAATVDFATADGTARQKSKYTNSAGTLAFAAGVGSRTFRVLLIDNQLAEGDESLNLLLSNPVGSGLNSPGRAVLNITDNDTTLATGNPMDDARYFVTQHYYDFLNRVPDQSGLDFWTGQITQCGADVQCIRAQRITVSNAFFYEQEYQQTGSYVVRLYRAAFGNNQPISNNDANPNFPNENKKLVNYSVFSTDRARVRGGPSLAQTQLDLANAFVLRSQFLARYPSSLAGPAYVDALLAGINTDIGVDLSSQRQALIDLFNSGGRGAVLYRLADDNTQTNPINNRAFIDAEYNRSFVLTQYFGYLRRNPDIGGYIFWLGQVNSAPLRALEKQRAMVCSFITSTEYQQRFSPVATHSNTECQ